MKISYFCIVYFFVMSLSVKSNIFDELLNGAKKWWNSKSEEKKQAFYQTTQGHVTNIFTPGYSQAQLKKMYPDEYVQKEIVEPNANYAYDVFTQRLATDMERIKSSAIKGAGVTAAAAVVGAVTYGLYRWLTRKGMGGITNDSRAIDTNTTALFHQIDKKISDLTFKKILTPEDKEAAKALLLFITGKIKDGELNLKKFVDKKQALKKILEPKVNVGQPKNSSDAIKSQS